MRVLGLSASARVWGNTDILVWEALGGARSRGAEVRFLRLTDLALGPCSGCMACVFRDRDCVQDDRLPELLESLRWADAWALGSPAYVLGATAAVKTLQDRLIRFGMSREFAGRPGLALAAAGVPGWEPFALPQVSLTFLFLGMPVVDQVLGHGQGPGEVLDDQAACRRSREAGEALAQGRVEYRGDPGSCPVCHLDLVVSQAGGRARCVLCDLPGRWEEQGGNAVFCPAPGAEPRWAEAAVRRHFEEKVLPSGARFRERARDLRGRVAAFRREVEP